MNTLGLRCTVANKRGQLMTIISLSNGEVHKFVFISPSIFSFKNNSGEILNWHRDNVLSLVTQFKIDAITVKKSERDSFTGRPKNSDIFKLYLEGVMLSLAGTIGLPNKHFYKADIKGILNDNNIFEKDVNTILVGYNKTSVLGTILASEKNTVLELVASVIALEKTLSL